LPCLRDGANGPHSCFLCTLRALQCLIHTQCLSHGPSVREPCPTRNPNAPVTARPSRLVARTSIAQGGTNARGIRTEQAIRLARLSGSPSGRTSPAPGTLDV